MPKKITRPPRPGDIVENVNHPDLDWRFVLSTGIATESSQYVEEGEDYVTLDFGGHASMPLPAKLYRVVKTRDQADIDSL